MEKLRNAILITKANKSLSFHIKPFQIDASDI